MLCQSCDEGCSFLRRRNALPAEIVVFVPIGISCLHFATTTVDLIALLRATLDSRGEIVK